MVYLIMISVGSAPCSGFSGIFGKNPQPRLRIQVNISQRKERCLSVCLSGLFWLCFIRFQLLKLIQNTWILWTVLSSIYVADSPQILVNTFLRSAGVDGWYQPAGRNILSGYVRISQNIHAFYIWNAYHTMVLFKKYKNKDIQIDKT